MSRSLFSTVVALYLSFMILPCICKVDNPIYIISNAESPSLKRPGLTPVGRQRAEDCIPAIFKSKNVGKIISCLPDKDSGLCQETVRTATPLAESLGLEIDTACGAGEESNDECVGDLMKSFSKSSDKAIVIVWDIQGMDDLFENIDADYPETEDDDDNDDGGDDDDEVAVNYDLITTVHRSIITSVESQNCTGIDGPASGTYRARASRKRAASTSERVHFHKMKMIKLRRSQI